MTTSLVTMELIEKMQMFADRIELYCHDATFSAWNEIDFTASDLRALTSLARRIVGADAETVLAVTRALTQLVMFGGDPTSNETPAIQSARAALAAMVSP